MERVAICISTRNRPSEFMKVLEQINKFWPSNYETRLFVVDDASYERYTESLFVHEEYDLYRFETRAGIPRVKNKCFEMAYEWGADHIFAFDDDCYPIKHGWADAYINSGCAHLSYTFLSITRRWHHFKFHRTSNGCMLYFKRICLDVVGGMDTNYGIGKFEHADLSRRIYNAGLTPHPYMDIKGSDKYFHSMDYHNEVTRTMTDKEQAVQFKSHIEYFNSKEKSKEYIEFRTNGNNNK